MILVSIHCSDCDVCRPWVQVSIRVVCSRMKKRLKWTLTYWARRTIRLGKKFSFSPSLDRTWQTNDFSQIVSAMIDYLSIWESGKERRKEGRFRLSFALFGIARRMLLFLASLAVTLSCSSSSGEAEGKEEHEVSYWLSQHISLKHSRCHRDT